MKTRYLLLISVLSIALSFWLGMKVERELLFWEEWGNPVYERKRIYFPNKETSLYLKSKTWGITGNHQTAVISTKPDLEFHPDSLTEYIFRGFSGYIYKVENDTLNIYSFHPPIIPSKFETEINVELIKIKNHAEWSILEEKAKNNYQMFE